MDPQDAVAADRLGIQTPAVRGAAHLMFSSGLRQDEAPKGIIEL